MPFFAKFIHLATIILTLVTKPLVTPSITVVQNGDELLKRHIEGAANAQYTSSFSATAIIEGIDTLDTWIDRKLEKRLKDSPFFSIMADESQDITSQEELSICCRWIVNGRPEEHFLTILHVTSTDAQAITAALTSFIETKGLEYHKLIGQGVKGTMEQLHFQEPIMEYIRGCRFMHVMLHISIVHVIGFN